MKTVSLKMFNGMVSERLFIDAREKIQNYHLSIFMGRLTRMDDIFLPDFDYMK